MKCFFISPLFLPYFSFISPLFLLYRLFISLHLLYFRSRSCNGFTPLCFFHQRNYFVQINPRQRSGFCGAWSFDVVNEVCYLHNIDACCGQKDKQEVDNNFISGYLCKQCWSTRNDCPCTLAERQQSVLDGKQISAGAKAKTVTSTVRFIL